jgi:hypothetical protein
MMREGMENPAVRAEIRKDGIRIIPKDLNDGEGPIRMRRSLL